MTARSTRRKEGADGASLTRGVGLTGRVTILWAAAGGILVGGFLVAALTLAGRLSAGGLFLTISALFAVGAVLGFAHGAVLGYLGRPEGGERSVAVRDLGLAALYTIPVLAVAWVLAGWIGMTVVAGFVERTAVTFGVALAWLLGAGVLVIAGREGLRALRHAYGRWRDRTSGTLLVTATFAALLVTFMVARPKLWGFGLEVNEVGAVLLALGLTLWLAGPLVTGGLWLVRRLARPGPGFGADWKSSVVLGLTAGVVLGVLALPFHEPPLAAPAAGPGLGPLALLVATVSQALLDEVILRLGVMTAVAWLLLRWFRVPAGAATAAAVGGTAVLQVLLYAPGVAGVGFPTLLATSGYLLVGVLVPAVAFGLLYWYRGLGTAVVADVSLLLTVAVLV